MLKVTLRVATPGAESAVYDCLVAAVVYSKHLCSPRTELLHTIHTGLNIRVNHTKRNIQCTIRRLKSELLVAQQTDIYCVPKKVSPLNILQQPPQTCTDLSEILHTQDDIYFCHRRQIS